jgi:hypothetical protein
MLGVRIRGYKSMVRSGQVRWERSRSQRRSRSRDQNWLEGEESGA